MVSGSARFGEEAGTIQSSRGTLRRWILRLHLYGGLLCSSYLMVYGVSSLLFNHPLGFLEGDRGFVDWEQPVELSASRDDEQFSDSVRAALGLFGHTLYNTVVRESDAVLRFQVLRPGRLYFIRVADGVAQVREVRMRVWSVLRDLHGGGGTPGSTLMIFWGIFTQISVVVLSFSCASGLYLWAGSSRDVRSGWSILAAAMVTFFVLLIYLAG